MTESGSPWARRKGGARFGNPNGRRGGARPVSGALRNRFTVHPFNYSERGETISETSMTFYRCNSCGAVGYDVGVEKLDTEEGTFYIENWQVEPLTHADTCPMASQA